MAKAEVKYERVKDASVWGFRMVRTEITSQFIKDEIKKGKNQEYIDHLLTIEHWIITGDDRATYDGLSIPWFSPNHPSQLARRYPEAYEKILRDNKGDDGVKKKKEQEQQQAEAAKKKAADDERVRREADATLAKVKADMINRVKNA